MCRPNFFIVGEPKSGTTAMFALLSQHPAVFFPKLKEPYFFCTDFHQESDSFHAAQLFFPVRSWRQYGALYKTVGNQPIVGEATPWYLASAVALRSIARFNGDARILVLLREPASFVISLHKEMLRGYYETEHDVIRALRIEKNRRNGHDVPGGVPFPGWLFYRDWMRYHEHLARCFEHFPRQQVKVLIFEEFRRDNAATYRAVAEWLGIDPTFEPIFRDVNKYGEGELAPVARYVYHPRLRAMVRKVLPLRWHDAVWDLAFRLFWRESPARKTDRAKVREILRDEIAETIERTSEILGRDLYEVWGEGASAQETQHEPKSAGDVRSE